MITNMEDLHLLERMRASDSDAFDVIFRKYYPAMCAYAQRLLPENEVEDTVQDSMVWLWEHRKELYIQKSLKSYLFKMLYSRSMNHYAKQEIVRRAHDYIMNHADAVDIPISTFDLEERIRKALDNLPQPYKDTFMMHRFGDKSYKDIAALLEVSPKTVDFRIQRALKILRDNLKEFLPIQIVTLIMLSMTEGYCPPNQIPNRFPSRLLCKNHRSIVLTTSEHEKNNSIIGGVCFPLWMHCRKT